MYTLPHHVESEYFMKSAGITQVLTHRLLTCQRSNKWDFWYEHNKCVIYCKKDFSCDVVFIIYVLRLNLNAHDPLRLNISQNELSLPGACLIQSAGSMFCTSCSLLSSFLKNISSEYFHILFRFLFCVLVFETFHVILDQSIMIDKLYLVHVFIKLWHLQKLKKSENYSASWMKIT